MNLKNLLARLLLLACAAALILLAVCNPLSEPALTKTCEPDEKTDSLVPGDIVEQELVCTGTLTAVAVRLETAPKASGGITLKAALVQAGKTAAEAEIPLEKKKAKSWQTAELPAALPAGTYTLRVEVTGEGSVKLGTGKAGVSALVNGTQIGAPLSLQLRTAVERTGVQLIWLGGLLGLLALIPLGGRRKNDAE